MEDIDEVPFVVVEFADLSQVEAVPSNWLFDVSKTSGGTQGKCFWPNNKSRVESFVKNRKEPQKVTLFEDKERGWTSYPVVVRRWCKTLKEARSKANQCQFTSDLESDSANMKNRHMRAKKRNRFEDSSEDDDDFNEDEPAIISLESSGYLLNQEHSSNPCSLNTMENNTPTEVRVVAVSKTNDDNSTPSSVVASASKTIMEKENPSVATSVNNSPAVAESVQNMEDVSKLDSRETSSPLVKDHAGTPRRAVFSFSPSKARFSPNKTGATGQAATTKLLLREMAVIKRKLDNLQITATKIHHSVAPPLERPEGAPDIPALPIQDFASMAAWHDWLLNENNFSSAVNLLATHGASNLKDSVYNMLRAILADQTAVKYNLKGTNRKDIPEEGKKKGFGDTLSFKAIAVALKKYCDDYNKGIGNDLRPKIYYIKDQVEGYAARWLKDAKKRCENQEKKKCDARSDME